MHSLNAVRRIHALMALLAVASVPAVKATAPNAADQSIKQFLARHETHSYRAVRRLEAENGDRRGWIEAITEYSSVGGLQFEITSEGGSGYIRKKVLRALLEAERDAFARGDAERSALVGSNYTFEPAGVGADGLVAVLLSPRRKEHALVEGTMFLHTSDGALVRLQGRLAKNPSFWVKNVDIVRSYERIGTAVMPIALESRAQLRMLGPAKLRMTYSYLEIDRQPIDTATPTELSAYR
jgi:hypothetical protein